jgi:hypothetical protein
MLLPWEANIHCVTDTEGTTAGEGGGEVAAAEWFDIGWWSVGVQSDRPRIQTATGTHTCTIHVVCNIFINIYAYIYIGSGFFLLAKCNMSQVTVKHFTWIKTLGAVCVCVLKWGGDFLFVCTLYYVDMKEIIWSDVFSWSLSKLIIVYDR